MDVVGTVIFIIGLGLTLSFWQMFTDDIKVTTAKVNYQPEELYGE